NAQNSPCIATDGSGGAIVVWQDLRTNYADLYAQRISKDGEMLWAIDSVLICGTSGAQSAPVVVEDGAGGVIVVWQDFRRSYADIYAQRVDGSGKILWDKNGVAVCTASGHESFPVIISNRAEGAVIAWVDTRNGNNDVFSQQLDGNGAIQWKENGVAVSIAKGNQNYPVITSDGAGGAYIAWSDMRSGESDIYIQRIDIAGNALWVEDGWGICTEAGIQNYVNIDNDGAGGVSLVWNDSRKSTFFDVYAQWIDQKGQLRWGDKGLAVSMASDTQCYPVITNDGIGRAVISWQDARNKDSSYWDIYAQKVNEKGSLGQ
ncbi:MAG TPA: TolB family protein, partial [Candidatus Wujingus californicus]|uniref:TolB family protein n=2 Tax=Candidatus Wujingus californicus TaxID=3367618 RepID=UPI0040256CFD